MIQYSQSLGTRIFSLFSFFLSFFKKKKGKLRCIERRRIGYAHPAAAAAAERRCGDDRTAEVESFFNRFPSSSSSDSLTSQSRNCTQSLYATHLTFLGLLDNKRDILLYVQTCCLYLHTIPIYAAEAVVYDCAVVVSMAGAAQHQHAKRTFSKLNDKTYQQQQQEQEQAGKELVHQSLDATVFPVRLVKTHGQWQSTIAHQQTGKQDPACTNFLQTSQSAHGTIAG